jgi:hypothetical protein
MKQVNEDDVRELAAVHDLLCVSIFIPVHAAADKDGPAHDSLLLRNQLKTIKNKLLARGFAETESEKFITPVKELTEDTEFWRLQSGGLAIFLSGKVFKKYKLPVQDKPFHYVSTEFYVLPLFSDMSSGRDFFLLSLELDQVRLYRASRGTMEKINIAETVPAGLEQVVGSDYEQKSLQFRSQQAAHGHSIIYGHGEGKDDNKIEINKFLKEVDGGLTEILKDETAPLLVASVDYLFYNFKDLCSYKHLYDRHIAGNPRHTGLQTLLREGEDLLQPFFNKTKKDKTESFRQLQGTGSTSNRIEEILPAAIHGRIDSMFILKNRDVFGLYDDKTRLVNVGKKEDLAAVSLFNFVVKEAFLNGANIYLVDQEEMPDGFSTINALFRY